MKILAVSGSASAKSSNTRLLNVISEQYEDLADIEVFDRIRDFPLFRPEDLDEPLASVVVQFKSKIRQADAVIICTPEYTHNIPAALKNALEWITASGELKDKKVLAMTLTPREPRGQYAMQSLLFSLKTMEAKIVAQLPLYQTDFNYQGDLEYDAGFFEIIRHAIELL